jgi:hypothetical protein
VRGRGPWVWGCQRDVRKIHGVAGQSSSSLGFRSSSISQTGLGSRGGRGRDEVAAAAVALVLCSFSFSRSTANGCGLGAGLAVTALVVRRGGGAREGIPLAAGLAEVAEVVVRDCFDNASWRRLTFTPPIPGHSASSSGVAFAIFANDYIIPQHPTRVNRWISRERSARRDAPRNES